METRPSSFDLELLSEHSEWVRALARSLVRDSSAAEDVEQETWVAALRTPPDAGRPVRAWLGAVARNIARQHGRARERRARRERLAARPEALPSDEQLAERVALQQWVVEQVMALDEPYRRTILLRFFEGLPPREIAVRMGVPLETVKTRLGRALARLRKRLDSESGPDGVGGVSALIPLVLSAPSSAACGVGLLLMGKKSLLFVATLLLLLASGVWYLTWWPAQVAPLSDGIGDLSSAQNATRDGLWKESDSDPAARIAKDELERRATSTAVELSFVLRTITADGGRPVAGAQIRIASWEEVSDYFARNGSGESFDIEMALNSSARSARSDERGEVRLAELETYSIAIARSGELFGQVVFQPEAGVAVDLPLRIDRSITIQTVTDEGKPISGIPVGLAPSDARTDASIFWWAITSGTEGSVTVHHVDHSLQQHLQPGVTWKATLASPWPSPPTVHIDPQDLPETPVRLVVATGGRVVVQVENEQGESHVDEWVYLTQVGEDRDAVGRFARPRRHVLRAREGRAVFENVGLNLELRAAISPSTHRPVEKIVDGPTRVGEEVVVRLRLGERYPTFSGSLADEQGSALAGRLMILRVLGQETTGQEEQLTTRFRTDEQGHFAASLPTRSSTYLPREVVVSNDESYEGATLSARVVLKDPRSESDIDLGLLLLAPPPVMLTGRVIDSDGEPIEWAWILVKRMAGPNVVGGAPYEWIDAWQRSTHPDGSFQLTEDQGLGDYRLCISKPGYLTQEDIPFRLGTRDLEVVLRRASGLEGRLRLAEGVPPSWLRVTVKREADRRELEPEPVRPNADGSFFLLDLAPGAVEVTVRFPAWPEPIAHLTDIRVQGEGTHADPRLDLDLRNAIHRIDLHLRDRAGEAIPIGCVAFEHASGGWSRTAFTEGAIALLTRTPVVDLEVIASGFRPRKIQGAGDGLEIVLERGIPVRVKLPEDFRLPDPPQTLAIQLVPAGTMDLDRDAFVYADDGSTSARWDRAQYGVTATLDKSREQILEVGSPGRWQVSWFLRNEGSADHRVKGATGYPEFLEVDESRPLEVVELAPDAKELERWVTRSR